MSGRSLSAHRHPLRRLYRRGTTEYRVSRRRAWTRVGGRGGRRLRVAGPVATKSPLPARAPRPAPRALARPCDSRVTQRVTRLNRPLNLRTSRSGTRRARSESGLRRGAREARGRGRARAERPQQWVGLVLSAFIRLSLCALLLCAPGLAAIAVPLCPPGADARRLPPPLVGLNCVPSLAPRVNGMAQFNHRRRTSPPP